MHVNIEPAVTRHHLRPVREDDAAAVLDAFGSAEDMARQGGVRTIAQAQEQVAWLLGPSRRATALADGEDRLVGLVAVTLDEGLERGKFLIDGERLDVRTCGRLRSDPWPVGPGLPWQA